MNSYDPKKVNVIVDGEFITGFMDGTFITSNKNADFGTPHVGAKGDVSFSESADETGTIVITLKQDSSSLPTLTKLAQSRKIFAAQVIDANTNQYQSGGNQCRILTSPGREFAAEISGVEISIYVGDYKQN